MVLSQYTGARVRRKEDPRLITGAATYVDDVRLPGMAHLVVVRSPYAHARINSVDTSAALELPGVHAVITGDDLAEQGLAWMPTLAGDSSTIGVQRQPHVDDRFYGPWLVFECMRGKKEPGRSRVQMRETFAARRDLRRYRDCAL